MTELEEETEKGEDSQTGKASDNNTQVQFLQDWSTCYVTYMIIWPFRDVQNTWTIHYVIFDMHMWSLL